MAVTKRTRYEVLRRDGHTCRYCGGSAPEVKLTVDHVMPVALGGSDDPSNLVTACRDCNAGKSSAVPDANLVAVVSDEALRWSAAMKQAAENEAAKRTDRTTILTHFKEHVWDTWTYVDQGKSRTVDLPPDWESAILRQLDAGLTMADLKDAVAATMKAQWVRSGEFRYFMGVCKHMLLDRIEAARAILDAEDGKVSDAR